MSSTGENDQALRGIIDFIRKGSLILLALHFYVHCYHAFKEWGATAELVERILRNLAHVQLISHPLLSKVGILALLATSLFGVKGRKDEKIQVGAIISFLTSGLLLFFGSSLLFYLELPSAVLAVSYMILTGSGFLLTLTGGARLSRLIKVQLGKDIFNELNETFPQEERLLENEFSINLPARYNLKGKIRRSFINIINPFRALLVCGGPGSR